MSIIPCALCGRSVSDRAPTCTHCGANPRDLAPSATRLDCNACRTPVAMQRASVKRFPWVVRLIGQVILLPSILGMLLGVVFVVSTFKSYGTVAANITTDAQRAGALVGLGVGYVAGIAVFLSSLVGGLLGWLLLLRRKVWKCVRCAHVIERA